MEGRKRKRSPHHTACWECHRLHRSCDGGRPCRRCVTNGKDDTCQSVPKKPFTRKRRTGDQWMKEQLPLSIFHQSPNISPSPIPSTTPSFSTPTSTTPKPEKEEKQDLLQELLRQVQQVHGMTQSLQKKQEILSQQLILLQSGQPPPSNNELSFASESLEASSSPSSPSDLSSPINFPPSDRIIDSPIPFYDLGQLVPSSDSPSSNTQELLELMDLSHLPQWNLSITISNDTERFKESLFIPFAVKDATAVQTKFPPTSFKSKITNMITSQSPFMFSI